MTLHRETLDVHQPLLGRLNARGFRLIMLADAILLMGVMVASMLARFGWDWPEPYPRPLYLLSFSISLAIVLASLYFGGMYERDPRLGAPAALPRAGRQMLGAVGLIALLNLASVGLARELGLATGPRPLPFPTLNLALLLVLGAVAVTVNRRLAMWLRTRREGPPQVLVVGSPDELEPARASLDEARSGARIVGEVTDTSELHQRLRDTDATDVVVLSSRFLDDLYPDRLDEFDRAGVTVLLRVTAKDTTLGLERIREVGGLPFVLLRSQAVPRSRARFKRLFDLVMLAIIAVPAAILMALVAIYQLVVVGRPLFYWQDRVGAGGKVFRMLKFRTMVVDAEEDGRGARLAEDRDPRVVRGCHWVRATRMDELPQLWNVVRGEMSLVGPRPERPELTKRFEQLIPGYQRRHELPPGLTGFAQIHGRYNTEAEYKLGYDLQYLVNWSPILDLEILARTVWVVIARRL